MSGERKILQEIFVWESEINENIPRLIKQSLIENQHFHLVRDKTSMAEVKLYIRSICSSDYQELKKSTVALSLQGSPHLFSGTRVHR